MRRHATLIAFASTLTLLACGSPKPTESSAPTPAVVGSASDPSPATPAPAPAVATTGGTAPAAAPAPATTPAAAPALAASDSAGETKEGTVVYEELPRTKSVRAYTGEELFLDLGGERITLRPTDAVDRDRLLGLDGRKVRVRVVWYAGHAPDPRASAPVDVDGKPLPQGAGWRVLAVEEI